MKIKRNSNKKKDKNEKEKNIRITYIPVMAGMVILVIVALFLPQLFFALQDQYNMQRTELTERDKFDIANLNLTYEPKLSTRLKNFAEEEKHYVTSIEYDVSDDAELTEILTNTFFQQDFIYVLYGNGFLNDNLFLALDNLSMEDRMDANEYYINVKEWKKYIFYGEELEEGVTLMAWYIDFFILDGTEIKVLADVESGTVYYLKEIGSSATLNGWESKETILNQREMFYEDGQEYVYYYSIYYEANTEMIDDFFFEKEAYNAQIYDAEVTDEAYNAQSYNAEVTEKEKEAIPIAIETVANVSRLSFPLYYGESGLTFSFEADFNRVYNRACPNITIGIPEIGELVQEMLQN